MLEKLKNLLKLRTEVPIINFLGIGAQKSGTTWLHENLRHHPEIFMPDIKEVHFFNEHFSKGIEWYKTLFANKGNKKAGEITPAYSILDREKIQYIKGLNKDLRLIYILRNPIERAWSAALMDMKRANLEFNETPDIWFINHFNSEGSLKRGDYVSCMENWLDVFPKKNFLILSYEQIKSNPQTLLSSCCIHLGVRQYDFNKELAGKKVFEGPQYEIRPSLKKILDKIYIEKISEQKKFFAREFNLTLFN